MVKIKYERWKVAQENEKKFWDTSWKQEMGEKRNLIKDYWKFHMNILKKYVKVTQKTKILEIGGGANPFIDEFSRCKKYSLDPLMDYFKANFKLPKGVKYIKGMGEKLPFKKESIGLVLITNVIDHVDNPQKVLSEIKRVLEKGGIVYLSIDCHTFLLKKYKIIKEFLGWGDPPHPHSFSLKTMIKFIENQDLKILHVEKGIGNQGAYTTRRLGGLRKEPLIKKAFKIINEKGVILFADALITKILISIGNVISPERDRTDFIFIIGKL